jgi:hypothetical protein
VKRKKGKLEESFAEIGTGIWRNLYVYFTWPKLDTTTGIAVANIDFGGNRTPLEAVLRNNTRVS